MGKSDKISALQYSMPLISGIQDFDVPINKEWASRFVQMAYQRYDNLCDRARYLKYKGIDLGITDEFELKNFYDTKNESNPNGGKAEYMKADWSLNPLIQSLNKIPRAHVVNIETDIKVNGVDRLSIDKKTRKKHEIVAKKYAIDLINFLNSATNDLPISDSTNLSSYTEVAEGSSTQLGESDNMLEMIKSEMSDDWSVAALSDIGLLKDGVESSHEELIKYFYDNLEFKLKVLPEIVSDLMKVRTSSWRFYTSALDGTPQVQYMPPIDLKLSPFKEKDGSDLDYWYYEFAVTWSDYMKMIGGKLTLEQNKDIYEANRTAFYLYNQSYLVWQNTQEFYSTLTSSTIRLGYFEGKKHFHDPVTDTYYYKWVKFYYLPIFSNTLALNPDYILDLGDLQDQYRYGNTLQNAKPSLVIFKDRTQASWYDIQSPDLLRLNLLYAQYMNTMLSIVPRGVLFAEETLREIAQEMANEQKHALQEKGVDINQDNGLYTKALESVIKRTIQSGKGIFKRREGDGNEKQLDPPTFTINHYIYDDLIQIVNQMMAIYNSMITSLGTNPVLLGQAPKPRQSAKGVEMASQSGLTMLSEIVDMVEYSLKEFGSRMIYWDRQVSTEFTKKFEPKTARAALVKAIIGGAGIGYLEIVNDMYEQNCSMVVENAPSPEEKLMLLDYTMELELAGKVPTGTAFMVQEIKNVKKAKMYLIASVKRAERIAAESQAALMQQQQQMQQQQIQQQMAIEDARAKREAQLQAQLDTLNNQLKQDGMSRNIAERGENKEREAQRKAELDIEKKAAEKQMESL